MGIRDELRRLPAITGLLLVGLAIIVLAVRVCALVVDVLADAVERGETAVADAVGTLPFGTRVVLLPEPPAGVR